MAHHIAHSGSQIGNITKIRYINSSSINHNSLVPLQRLISLAVAPYVQKFLCTEQSDPAYFRDQMREAHHRNALFEQVIEIKSVG